MLQPSEEKLCSPCSSPQNSGIQNERSTTIKVTHNPIGLLICQCSRIRCWNESTSTETTAQITNEPPISLRINLVNSFCRLVANANAVWCAITICKDIVGMTMATDKKTPNAPYSLA